MGSGQLPCPGQAAARIATAAGKAGKFSGLGTDAARAGTKSWIDKFIPSGTNWVGPREANWITPNHIKEFAPEMFDTLSSVAKNQKGGAFDLAGQMDTPLGALGTFWPAGEAGVFGAGKTGQKIARGMDVAGDMLRHAKIPGTAIRPVGDLANLVNAKAGKTTNAELLQDAYQTHHVKEGARYEHRLLTAKWTNDLERMGHAKTEVDTVRNWIEFPNTAPAEAQPLVKEMRGYVDKIPKLAEQMGVKIGDVSDKMSAAGSQAQYWPRHLAEGLVGKNKKRGSFGKLFDPATTAELAREPWTLGSKGGTKALMEMYKDPEVLKLHAAGDRDALVDYLKNNYSSNLPEKFLDGEQIAKLKELNVPPTVAMAGIQAANNPALAKSLAPSSTFHAAADSILKMSPEALGAGVYANHPVNDFAASMSGTADKLHASKIALERIASDATAAGPGTVEVPVVLKNLDLEFGDGTSKGAIKWLKDHGVADPEKAHLPADTAAFLTQMGKGWTGGPQEVGPMLDLYDNFANIMRSVFTNMDPVRYNVRNRLSGHFANWISGLVKIFDGTATNADQLMKGMVIEGAAKNPHLLQMAAERGIQNLDDKTATQILGEMLYALETSGSSGLSHEIQHGSGNIGSQLGEIKDQIPGANPFSWGAVGELAKGPMGKAGTSYNPLSAIRGVGGAPTTKNALAATGEKIAEYTEGLNRIAPMWSLIQDGVHPQEAARRVMEAQVDYRGRNYTQFEKQLLKRIFLFYSFSKGMFPFTLKQVMDYPGGRLAQALRGMNRSKSQDELVPQHVAETAAIPVGQIPGMAPLEEGAKRYITGFGLGFEDPAQFVGGPQNAMLEAASRLNPLIKAPLEMMSGQSFFQRGPGGGGRSLEDLNPSLGQTLSNIGQITGMRESKAPVRTPQFLEHILSNSPLSGVLNKARTITDPRKGPGAKAVNLLTGIKATDVSPAAQDKELRSRISQIEKQMGARTFSDTFLPKDAQAELSPKELADYQKMQALRRLLEERSKTRKKK